MLRLTVGKALTGTRSSCPCSTKQLRPPKIRIRNASTGKTRSKKPTATSGLRGKGKPSELANSGPSPKTMTWTIEPEISFWMSKLRMPASAGVVVLTVSLAVVSLVSTSLAFPDPSAKDDGTIAEPSKSPLSMLFFPIKFILRPLFADPEARRESRKTWKFWLGCTAGVTSLTIFGLSHFLTPRYIRLLSVSPSSSLGGKGAAATLRIKPALGRTVTYPLHHSALVSPLLDQSEVQRTIRVFGPPGLLGSKFSALGLTRGWGLNMFKSGAIVNGKKMRQEEVVALMEKLWVGAGGEIRVG